MGPGQPLLPAVRRAFLAFLLLCLVVTILQWLAAPLVPPADSWPILPSLLLLALLGTRLFRRGGPHLVADVLTAVCTGVVVWSVGPVPSGGVLFVGVALRSLYGRLAGALLATVMILGALAVAVLVTGVALPYAGLGQFGPGLLSTSLTLRLVLVVIQRFETGAAARFEAVVRSSRDVIVITDADTATGYVSPALRTVFGIPPEALPGARLLSWIIEEDRDGASSWVSRMLSEPGAALTLSCRVPTGDGGLAHVEINGQNLLDDPHVHGLLFAVRDVTQRTLLTEKLRHQAFHDTLTGLGNRALLAQRLTALREVRDDVALLLLDIDSFKTVNDTLGHVAGDALLREVADRLLRRLLPNDTLVRLGGDEFAVVLAAKRADPLSAEQVAGVLLEALRPPVTLSGDTRRVTASIGIAVRPGSGETRSGETGSGETGSEDADSLLKEADIALYRAKNDGKARYVRYRHELDKRAVDQMRDELELAGALSRKEFVLYYQPVYDLADGAWTGVEALLRWDRPGRGLVGPGEFIALAESSGLIVPLGRWVVGEACLKGAAWRALAGRALQVNVNVSMRQFVESDVVADVGEALELSGLSPSNLTLEITESALAADDDAVASQLVALRLLGVQIALDDFGTGFNSLGYLHRYPVDELKIDKSFVARIGPGSDPVPVMDAIMAMSRGLGLRTVAEGIETTEQQARLTALGCDRGQGFRLSPPLTGGSLEEMIRRPAS